MKIMSENKSRSDGRKVVIFGVEEKIEGANKCP